jgi:hypothetical protein
LLLQDNGIRVRARLVSNRKFECILGHKRWMSDGSRSDPAKNAVSRRRKLAAPRSAPDDRRRRAERSIAGAGGCG